MWISHRDSAGVGGTGVRGQVGPGLPSSAICPEENLHISYHSCSLCAREQPQESLKQVLIVLELAVLCFVEGRWNLLLTTEEPNFIIPRKEELNQMVSKGLFQPCQIYFIIQSSGQVLSWALGTWPSLLLPLSIMLQKYKVSKLY